jgi:hypothetical protein
MLYITVWVMTTVITVKFITMTPVPDTVITVNVVNITTVSVMTMPNMLDMVITMKNPVPAALPTSSPRHRWLGAVTGP